MSLDQTNLEDAMDGAASNAGGDEHDDMDDDIPEGDDDNVSMYETVSYVH
jgi:hypothetical protein